MPALDYFAHTPYHSSERGHNTDSFLRSVFRVVEFITEAELRNTSKHLIRSYMAQSGIDDPSDQARYAIQRYTQTPIPSLQEIREKSRSQPLEPFDHLLLKMEYEAMRAGDSYGRGDRS